MRDLVKRMGYAAALLIVGSGAPAAAQTAPEWPQWIDLSGWSDVSEDYRWQFSRCDDENRFRNYKLPTTIGKRTYYGCISDKNSVSALRRSAPSKELPHGAIVFASKLSVDLDGSWYACNTPGKTDLCPTALMLRDADGKQVPVSSDHIPYVVIPIAGPTRELAREFRELTGVDPGDFGLVITPTEVIPVLVADGGPFPKLGEGSIALHRKLGRELCAGKDEQGRCLTVKRPLSSHPGPLITVLFPKSRRQDLNSGNAATLLQQEGERLWKLVRGTMGSSREIQGSNQ